MKKALGSLFILVIFWHIQSAEQFDISIRYLSLPVVKVNINHSEQLLRISAEATGLAKIAARMNNYYEIQYDSLFYPVYYRKKVMQSDFEENKTSFYYHSIGKAIVEYAHHPESNEYQIHSESRDFFSALFFLRTQLDKQQSGILFLDANKITWKARWEVIGEEKIRTFSGRKNCDKVRLSFERTDDRKKERSDMLTNNLVNENNDLFFWFTKDENKLPVKANFAMRPFPVIWVLNNYENE